MRVADVIGRKDARELDAFRKIKGGKERGRLKTQRGRKLG